MVYWRINSYFLCILWCVLGSLFGKQQTKVKNEENFIRFSQKISSKLIIIDIMIDLSVYKIIIGFPEVNSTPVLGRIQAKNLLGNKH